MNLIDEKSHFGSLYGWVGKYGMASYRLPLFTEMWTQKLAKRGGIWA
jgi:hypothetical protein